MPHISIICPHCAQQNDIYASGAPEPIQINCSRCHALLGTWNDLDRPLRAEAPRTREPAHHF